MTELYYASAEDAARGLDLPLLLATSSSTALPRHADRLSAYAPDSMLSARLFHRVISSVGNVPNPVLWIVGPSGTLEYLPWAIGVAEHAARAGKTAYLVDLDQGRPLRIFSGGGGRPLPLDVRLHLASIGIPHAAAWTTDLQGVRLVIASENAADAESISGSPEWMMILAQSLPEEPARAFWPRTGVDGAVLAAGIRDHTGSELAAAVRVLRTASIRIFGLVSMGPVSSARGSLLERWERPVAAPPMPAVETPSPIPEGPPESIVEPPPAPEPVEPPVVMVGQPGAVGPDPVEEPISLVADWHQTGDGGRRGIRAAVWIALAVAVLAGGGWWFGARGRLLGRLDSRRAMIRQGEVRPAPADSGAAINVPTSDLKITSWPDTFVIHVKSYRQEAEAIREAGRLQTAGYQAARVVPVVLPERGRWHRVVIGAYPDSDSAVGAASQLKTDTLIGFTQVLGRGGHGGRPGPTAP